MKKEKKGKRGERWMSEGEWKNLGGNLWLRRKAKGLIVLAVLALVWMLVGAVILKGWIGVTLSVLPILSLCLVFIVRMDKEGKKLWNWAKDKEQPVDADKYQN